MFKLARPARNEGGLVHQLAVIVGVSAMSGVLLAGLALPWVGLINKGAEVGAEGIKSFPLPLKFNDLPQRTTVLTANGTKLASFYDEGANRKVVPLDDVSYILRKAIIAIEDVRFYEHGAIDAEGTSRAWFKNLLSGGVVQGGSTITQQLVKLTRLQNAKTPEEAAAATEDTKARKIKELRYAVWVEDHMTKNQILERYLNTAYFGDGAYGIQMAAQHYFSVDASELNLKQAALLAGLVKNPTGYDPTNHPGIAKDRRDTVLNTMRKYNLIQAGAWRAAKKAGLGLKIHNIPNGCIDTKASWFCDYLINYLMQDPDLGATEEERHNLIYDGGLTIKTTVQLRDQKAADKSVSDHVFATDPAIGALAIVEPGTGYVRALAQSRPMGKHKHKGETFLNYTVPKALGDANGFQAGSNFKPFVLSAAIKQHIPLNTQINAPQTIHLEQSSFRKCPGDLPSVGSWDPSNSTGAGTYDLYTGTQQSINTFYAQLEQMTGLCQPWHLAEEMGVTMTDPAVNRVPSWVLGVVDVSPIEMAGAYATFAARGMHCAPTPVLEIHDADGNLLPTAGPQCNRVMKPAQADAVNDILRGVQEGGGFGAIYGDAIDQPSAAKTGTTSDTKAVWFTGYTPNLATAAVVAGVTKSGEPQDLRYLSVHGNILNNETAGGAALAGPLWHGAMSIIAKWLPDIDFKSPNPSVVEGQTIEIPSYYGYSVESAASDLTRLGLHPQISTGVYSSAPYGTVAYTSPSGSAVSGQSVLIYTSIGPDPNEGNPPDNNGGGNDGGNDGGGNPGNGNGNGGGNDGGHGPG